MTNIEIANQAVLQPIQDIAQERLSLSQDQIELYGRYKAKISLSTLSQFQVRPDGKLILVTAMTPTTAGEGKTTTSVGLADGLNKIGKKAHSRHTRTQLGTMLWDEGWCLWRWICTSGADGGYQFAFHG